MSAEFGHKRVAHETFEAQVDESLLELYRYAYWLCGGWTAAESLIDATLASEQCALEVAGKDEAEEQRKMITALHKEHTRQRQREKQDASSQSQPVDCVGDKVADFELRNLRIGIASLPTKYREPLVLQSIGYSIEDIAELLESTAVLVAARLAHARKQLQALQDPDDETPDNILDDS